MLYIYYRYPLSLYCDHWQSSYEKYKEKVIILQHIDWPQFIEDTDHETEGVVRQFLLLVLWVLELVEPVQQLGHQLFGQDEHTVGRQERFLEHELCNKINSLYLLKFYWHGLSNLSCHRSFSYQNVFLEVFRSVMGEHKKIHSFSDMISFRS